MARSYGSLDHEGNRAAMATAGVRLVLQGTVTALAGASTAYTVQSASTRRVMVIHLSSGNGDIRFDFNSAATATDVPVLPGRYFVVDASKDETLNFWNTTVGNITINVVEML